VIPPTAAVADRAHLLRGHGVAAFFVGVLLLWGAGFAQMEDGGTPLSGQGEVVSALASDAGSSVASERLRSVSSHGPQRGISGERPGPPPIQ
jgi:hypothetical protein